MEVVFNPIAYKKLKTYIDLCEYEISGMGFLYQLSENSFVCYDIKIYKQKCSGVRTKMCATDLAKETTELIREGRGREAHMCLWWHSHANMNAFWSPVDMGEINEFEKTGKGFSLVMNKRGDYECRFDLFDPYRISMEGIEVVHYDFPIMEELNNKIIEDCKQDIKNKVKFLWKTKNSSDKAMSSLPKTQRIIVLPSSDAEVLGAGLPSLLPNWVLDPLSSMTLTKLKNTTYLPNSSQERISVETKPKRSRKTSTKTRKK